MPVFRLEQAVSSAEAVQPFDLSDKGLLLGDGVFDTSLVMDGRMILRTRHIERLLKACDAFGLAVSRADLDALADSALSAGGTGALRLTVTRGPGGRGLEGAAGQKPTLLASFSPQRPTWPAQPVRLCLSAIRRNPTAPSARYKTLAYTDAVAGHRQARAAGFDDALYCTMQGQVACSSIANLFAQFGDRLITPPQEDGVIAGVMRGWILEHAAAAGLKAGEESLDLATLKTADGVFLTNSLRLIVPVVAIDEMAFDPAMPKPLEDLVAQVLRT
ncbi:aminotransferase class IV [uncultured Hyphomonas sp.]|uniref:aminotransferase class IV n=1 Tax=uncultured Hyphomonas sp. TaxID=225298 RepID=UPI002AAB4A6C|nr:aminotransferase class IV [uncultured Hyphomonas sp.]